MEEQAGQRIAVVGSPGGGKSVLSTAISAASGLPLIHLDVEHWQPGWTEPDAAAWRARNDELAGGERWVIDGNYGGTLPIRLARATLVVWLDLPTRACLAGAIRRSLRYRRGERPDMAPGCPERFDGEWLSFLHYIATFRRRAAGGKRRDDRSSDEHRAAPGVSGAARRRRARRGYGVARLASSRIEMP